MRRRGAPGMDEANKITVGDWLNAFAAATSKGDGEAVAGLFHDECFWRDYLPFGWTLQTVEGRADIAEFAARHGGRTGFADAEFEGRPDEQEGLFRFRTNEGSGRGYIRLTDGLCTTLFTMLTDLDDDAAMPEPVGADPFVLIVGGGQGGLALGAQLADLGVPYLIVDRHPRVGDQWRSRYETLVLHDPVWYDHMPFKPFPDNWPVFTPKDQIADWLEDYARTLDLAVQTGTELTGASYDAADGLWSARLTGPEGEWVMRPTHLVFALGISGFPRVPDFAGKDDFAGQQVHSSGFRAGPEIDGENVVIIGANNSAHDIAVEVLAHGGAPTIVQRSSTLVVRQSDFCERLMGRLYSAEAVARGITTDKADIIAASLPTRLLEKAQIPVWDKLREDRRDYYQALTDAGFTLDFAEDGAGLGLKYRRTASGYYIDVGASGMVIDGRIGIRSGHGVERLTEAGVRLTSGEELPADLIVYATGYGSMSDWIAHLIDEETAERVGPCWGYGSGTRGDPGPWVGEQRNMWMETAQLGLWLTGGNLAQARFCSRLLGLQLRKRLVDKG